MNLHNKGDHKINFNAYKSHTRLEKRQINSYERYGGNIEYEHRNGHGAFLGVQNIPKKNHQSFDANAKINVWKSNDHRTSFDWSTGALKISVSVIMAKTTRILASDSFIDLNCFV